MPILEPEEKTAGGRFDHPPETVLPRGEVTLSGWTLFETGPTLRVELRLGDVELGPARLGLPRPDVAEGLQTEPAAVTGFELRINLEDWAGPRECDLFASVRGPDGRRLDLGPLPLRIAAVGDPPPEKRAPSPRGPGVTREGLRTLIVTHELGLGGAQLYLIDLIRELLRTETVDPTVIAAVDGPLREELEELGVPVHVSGAPPGESLAAHLGRVEEIRAWVGGRQFDVAFVNTATGLVLPGVEIARQLEIPVVWAIHESFELSTLWAGIDPGVRRRGERLLGEAEVALFVAEATQRLFEPLVAANARTIPYGLDLAPIEAERRGFDRAAVRRQAGIPVDADLALCVGTIEPRKGQVALAQAFDLVAERHPRARLALVGGRDDADTRFLADHAATLRAADRIEIVPSTPEVQPWFGASDFLVCASDVESLPRTALEAMAWGVPVLATEVFGLPELVEDGRNGWLCAPRDVGALAEGLDRALTSTPEERRQLGREGRALVEERHSLPRYGREVAGLLEGLAAAGAAPASTATPA
ncbi:MAG TPA: glycosyltransferase family 4 protein [Solirubrobacterales bacterium]|nr:glycosyltransferase family 4 protein [Solirubrobacterales bacterium]